MYSCLTGNSTDLEALEMNLFSKPFGVLVFMGSFYKQNYGKGVMTWSMELCFPFLKGGNSAFIAAIASGLFPQTEYRSLE